MATKKDERANIKVKRKTFNDLKRIGYFGETFDDIIQRLIQRQIKKMEEDEKKPRRYQASL